MNLLNTIKDWFAIEDKTKIDHFEIQRIESVLNKIKADPFLKFMQEKIEGLLYEISLSSKDKKGLERKFIIIDGVGGSGKTNLVYEYLKEYLLSTGVIKLNQGIVTKLASHDLTDIGLRGKRIEEVISEKVNQCKDGILIIDEFTARDKNSFKIADLIRQLYSANDYKYTAIILMGDYRSNSMFIETHNLENVFKNKFRLSFYTPSFPQIADIFEEYAKREGNYTLTEKAKASLIFYFSKTKQIKETKFNLNRDGIMKFPFRERNYVYTSEMFPIYKEIAAFINSNRTEIDQQDVLGSAIYKKLIEDLNVLHKYIVSN